MPGLLKNTAQKQPCYCVTCNGAIMSNRTFQRYLNRPQIKASVSHGGGSEEETSGSDDSSLDLHRPTKRARTGRRSIDLVCFKLISTYIPYLRYTQERQENGVDNTLEQDAIINFGAVRTLHFHI
jgi:hypothetical protein